jgi:hypothetical protein
MCITVDVFSTARRSAHLQGLGGIAVMMATLGWPGGGTLRL